MGCRAATSLRTWTPSTSAMGLGSAFAAKLQLQKQGGGRAFEPLDAGVSEYGGKVIERMNAVGMVVDVGHASDKTKLDALEMSKKPIILSHGNCRALIPASRRASTDEAIKKLAAKCGVMGIADIAFMVKSTEPVTVEDVVDHFDHVRDLVGIEHVGVGSDAGIESNDLGDPKIAKRLWNAPTSATTCTGPTKLCRACRTDAHVRADGRAGAARLYRRTDTAGDRRELGAGAGADLGQSAG